MGKNGLKSFLLSLVHLKPSKSDATEKEKNSKKFGTSQW